MKILSKSLVVTLVIALIMGYGSISQADSCQNKLNLCDKAVKAAIILINDQDQQIKNYADETGLQAQIIADKDKQLSSPLRDPVKVGLAAVVVTVLVLSLSGHVR